VRPFLRSTQEADANVRRPARCFVSDPHVPNSGIFAANKIHRIGRITEGLLLGIAEKVDIVEPIAKFSENLKGKAGIGEIFNVGLEDWSPQESEELKYDLIWNQWCLGHLTDSQLTTYLVKCQKVLKTDGLIIVKENMSTSGGDVFDEVDSSVTRCVTSPL
jgi:protein N-terminal methyltransferase